jgi:hemolysin D
MNSATSTESAEDRRPAPDTGLLGLAMLARYHGLAADPDQLAHQHKAPGEPFGVEQILLAAKGLGLKARRVDTDAARLDRTPLPALASGSDGRFFILARVDGEQALIQVPGEARPQQIPLADLASRWTGELILFASRASLAGELAKFDFTWFIPAVVRAIKVADGQSVKAGEVLIELDTTNTTADATRIGNDLLTARLQAARARALLAGIAGGRPPALEPLDGVPAARLLQEQHLLDGQYGEYAAKLARIEAEIAKREAELRSIQEVVRKLEQTAPIARQRARDFKDLVDKNFISRHGYLEKEQVRIEQEADLATQKSRIAELAAALQEGRSQRVALVAETRRLALDSLGEAEQKTTAYGQELVKAESRGRLMTLTAPMDGTVQQLAVHTVGGVVTEAQPLMMIVPKDNPVEVKTGKRRVIEYFLAPLMQYKDESLRER